MLEKSITWIVGNLSLSMFILAYILAFLNAKCCSSGAGLCENIFRWVCFLSVGFTSLYTFIMQTFFGQHAEKWLWWPSNAFQFEVGFVNLAVGVIALFACKASTGYRKAVVLATTCWFWGEVVSHINQMHQQNTLSLSNTNSWFWMAVIIPVVLIATSCKSSKCCH